MSVNSLTDGEPETLSLRRPWPVFAETAAVIASPVVAFFVLRLRVMAPTGLPDPAMHTIYLVDPHDVFLRYGSIYQVASAGLRESARVGFLIPARIDYLLFGAVPGFIVTRYLFALIAVGPAYLLMRRLYGRPAGAIAVVAIMSCPIVVTAWGTDYPDSAVVSYLIGALACLAMPSGNRERRLWLAFAAVLLTMAVWAQSVSLPLVISTLAAYFAVRIYRGRTDLASDVAVMGAVAVAITAVLSLASGIGIGQYNFITPTWDSYRFLSNPAQEALWHTKGWRWLPYLPYLLVPPAVVGAWLVVFIRRLKSISTGPLIVGLACAAQTLVFACLQLFGSVETLEEHYFSSMLWGSVCLTLAITLAEASRPFFDRGGFRQWLPAALVLAVPLVYEAAPREHAFQWVAVGIFLAFVVLAGGFMSRIAQRAPNRTAVLTCVTIGIVAIVGGILYLSADPILKDQYLNQLADPAPSYSTALGGANAEELVDIYRVSTLLPGFVGNATYKNEQLLMWWPPTEAGILSSPTGMYHFIFNTLPSTPPNLTSSDVRMLDLRRPPELLLLNTTGGSPALSMQALATFHPVLLRSTVIRSGDVAVYVWLFNLRVFGPAR